MYLKHFCHKRALQIKIFAFFSALTSLLVFGLMPEPMVFAGESPCLTCHEKLKKPAKHVHAPMKMGCETCHKAVEGKNHPADKNSVVLSQKMPGLCHSCHKDPKFKSSHTSFCTNCHDAHQSNFSKLLKSGPTDVCYTCHDQAVFTKKYVHSIIPVGGCTACHNPHSNKKRLLDKDMTALCLDCHKAKANGRHIVSLPGRKIHPIRGVKDPSTITMIKMPDPKRPGKEILSPDPKTPGKEMSCASCHDPHSSDYKKLFPVERICNNCHKGY